MNEPTFYSEEDMEAEIDAAVDVWVDALRSRPKSVGMDAKAAVEAAVKQAYDDKDKRQKRFDDIAQDVVKRLDTPQKEDDEDEQV